MNILTGIITQIQQSNSILLIDIEVDEHSFTAMLIEASKPSDWLKVGKIVNIVFKETEVSLGRNVEGKISMRNCMKSRVTHIQRGDLLSNVSLQFKEYKISSVITTRSVDALKICVGDEIEAFIKSNEVSIMKISE